MHTIWSTHCNNIVTNAVKFDNMVNNIMTILFTTLSILTILLPYMITVLWKLTTLWQYCKIFSPYCETILLSYIITILPKWQYGEQYCDNIVHHIAKCDNIVENMITILLFCHSIVDHIAISHGEGWWWTSSTKAPILICLQENLRLCWILSSQNAEIVIVFWLQSKHENP